MFLKLCSVPRLDGRRIHRRRKRTCPPAAGARPTKNSQPPMAPRQPVRQTSSPARTGFNSIHTTVNNSNTNCNNYNNNNNNYNSSCNSNSLHRYLRPATKWCRIMIYLLEEVHSLNRQSVIILTFKIIFCFSYFLPNLHT